MARRTEFHDPNERDIEYFETRDVRVEGSYSKASVQVDGMRENVVIIRRNDTEYWKEPDARAFAEALLEACDYIVDHPSSHAAAMRRTIEALKRGGVTIDLRTAAGVMVGGDPDEWDITQQDIDAMNGDEDKEQKQ